MKDLFDLPPPPPPPPPEYPDGIPIDVCQTFEKLAGDIIKAGWTHYSSDAILHRIRWHMRIERGHREFKCNDHWTAQLARWWLARHPQHEGFFELRERRKDDGVDLDDL